MNGLFEGFASVFVVLLQSEHEVLADGSLRATGVAIAYAFVALLASSQPLRI